MAGEKRGGKPFRKKTEDEKRKLRKNAERKLLTEERREHHFA